MVVEVKCNKCNETGKFDIGEIKGRNSVGGIGIEQAQEKMDSLHVQSCPLGHHVEVSDISYTVTGLCPDERVKTDEEWLAEMREKYDLWKTDELRPAGIEITGFALGFPLAEVGGKDFTLNFTQAPTSGTRYYYAWKGELESVKGAA